MCQFRELRYIPIARWQIQYFQRHSLPRSEETGLGEATTEEANAAVGESLGGGANLWCILLSSIHIYLIAFQLKHLKILPNRIILATH